MSSESLFETITSWPLLVRAFDRVEENQGGPGVDGETSTDFGVFLDRNLTALRTELLTGRYQPRPLLRVGIAGSSGRIRSLSIPTVRDRIVQTAAYLVLGPLLDADFEDCSFAYRKGRSVQKAVRRILEHQARGYHWVVDADIAAFFDEVDHTLLLAELGQIIAERPVLDLIRGWISADVVDGDRRYPLTKGVPQGSPLSPLLSNLYLDHLDERLVGHGRRLVRFADDFVILCKDRPAAEEALELTGQILSGLKLRINAEKTRITDFNRGFRFLGYQFIRSLAIPSSYPEQPLDAAKPSGSLPVPPTAPEPAPGVVGDSGGTAVALAFREALAERSDNQRPNPAAGEETDEGDEGEDWSGLHQPPSDEEEEEDIPSGNDPLLRTLYLMEQGSVLSKEDERFVITKRGAEIRKVPAIKVDQILVFGNIHITTPALKFCLMNDIPVVLLSSRGRYYGVVEAVGSDRVFLQRDQFGCAEDPGFCLTVSREIVRGKIKGARLLLRRYLRTHGGDALDRADQSMHRIQRELPAAATVEALRGMEGAAAAAYFDAVRTLLDPRWAFTHRRRQPPPDPVNAVLSYTYTLLFYNIYALVRARGLNPNVGFFHPMREGHPALVSDLMEEFRAVVADAVTWPLFLHGTLRPEDFERPDMAGSPCRIGDDARKTITHAFERKMNSAITNPKTGFPADYRRLIAHQAEQMASAVRGESGYSAMVLK